MNADTVTLDVSECCRFMQFWLEVTGAPHLTLVSIIPDGATETRTFPHCDLDNATLWIVKRQERSRNIYFQPNETMPDCAVKPAKANMMAGLCRFADIDPSDTRSLSEERDRLTRLSEHLIKDSTYQPTVVIDSGNGIQPLWAVQRVVLSRDVISRIESETKAIELAMGAKGTHNIDRLLRLPGTINFPNAAKQKKHRPVSRARLIHASPNVYNAEQAAKLSVHLSKIMDGTGFVHPKAGDTEKPSSSRDDDDITALVQQLDSAGACEVSQPDHLPANVHDRLKGILKVRKRLADRWAGLVDDLSEAGKDSSGSGVDMSLAAMLKASGFNHLDTALILCAFPHGKANQDKWANPILRLRHVARSALRSHDVDRVAALMTEFNKRYMVVNEAGKAIIYEPAHDQVLNRRHYARLTFEDLRRLFLNRRVCTGYDGDGKPTMKAAADIWLHHPERRQFIGGVTFDPSEEHVVSGALNLWQGYAVQPRSGSWARMKDHIKQVICASNQDHCDWLFGWMARLMQHPGEQGEVAVVLRGGEGCGKGTLAKALLRILGQHGLAISNSKHLTGNFNGHLRDTVLLFADEAFFAGDRAHVGVLKSLITEPFLTIEAKYQNAVQMPNFVHLMMASNEDWVVPASLDARRFFVLEVSSTHANDHPYFEAIWQQMEQGGYEAMLHDLLAYDLTSFNPRSVPTTDGLHRQRKLSLGTSEAWWMDVLHRGFVLKSRLGVESYFAEWHNEVSTEILYASYSEFAELRRERHVMSRETFGRFMRNVVGAEPKRLLNAAIGERMADVPNAHGGTSRKAQVTIHPRPPGYALGELEACRHGFHSATGLCGDWPEL